MPVTPTTIRFTRAQVRALALVGRRIAPDLDGFFDDHRSTRAARRAFDALDDALREMQKDPIDLDLESFADLHAELRSAEMAALLLARVRDLLAVLIPWRAVEDLGAGADVGGLLRAEAIYDLGWRADVLDALLDHGAPVVLPGEGR